MTFNVIRLPGGIFYCPGVASKYYWEKQNEFVVDIQNKEL